ncbi:MAG: TonB family protein [Acidobacteria bacterium]|nr:TonB family protein [Acidobacteriota bacterium]
MDLFTTHVVTAVGITLVHFLWQGAAIGVVTAAVLATCPRAMARTRYLIAGAGLAAMTMAPLVTLGLVWQTAPAMTATLPAFTAETAVQATAAAMSLSTAGLTPWLPAAVGIWAVGVLLLTTRLLLAWARTERVRRIDVHPVGAGLQAAVSRLARDLGIDRAIALFESPWIDTPTVIGWLRPTILLPIGALAGLSVQQIEAVLSHELAHIKRHDYLVNVLQNLVETMFFYHPAVWWLSRQIRLEREHCCDDVAVEVCGNPVMYARALAALEESRYRQATLALAATDGSLVGRVRRLIGPAHVDARRPSLPIAACVAVILGVIAFSGSQAQATAPVMELTEVRPTRFVLPAGSTLAIRVPDGEIEPQREMPPAAAPFERVDGRTIRVDGETYTRGTAEDTARLIERLREGLAELAETRPRPVIGGQAAPPVVEATQVAPQAPAPIRVGGDIREPRKIKDVRPVYPEAARAAGISGVVILEATIDPEGMPVNIKILRSIPDLDQAAINAVREWRYQPTLLNGVPVAVMMTVTVNFALQPSQSSLQALEARHAALRTRYEELTQSPDSAEADRRLLQLQIAATERQIAITRAQVAGTPAPGQSPQAAPAQDGVARVGGGIAEPKKIRDVRPVYPADARAANVSGVVILEVVVDAEGNVTQPRILRGIPMLDQAALAAVSQWKYTPSLANGVPTPVRMTVTVNFALD